MKRVGLLWKTEDMGLYANSPLEPLYAAVGQNTGNLAYVYAIRQAIEHPVRHFAWGTAPEVLARECDVLVFPGANQLGRHTDLSGLARTLGQAGVPVVAIGVGAQAEHFDQDVEISTGTRAWIETVNRLRPGTGANIYTRGPYTARQLTRLGIADSVVGGCPTHFMNPDPQLGAALHARWNAQPLPQRISVAAGHEAWVQRTAIEHQLIALMMDEVHPGQYVTQSMLEMLRISRGEFDAIKPGTLAAIHRYTVPHYTLEEFKTWCRRYVHSFYDVPAWMDSLRRFDLAVGTRYHGVALALQAGVMGLTIAFDSRTRELCEQTGVPWVMADELSGPITRQTLRQQHVRFDPAVYDSHRRERAGNFAQFLQDNGLSPSRGLLQLAGRQATSVAVVSGSATLPTPAPANDAGPTGAVNVAAWVDLARSLKAPAPASGSWQTRASQLEAFQASPEWTACQAVWQAHLAWQPLPAQAVQTVQALPAEVTALFVLSQDPVAHRFSLLSPTPQEVAQAQALGLNLAALGAWAQAFLAPSEAWAQHLTRQPLHASPAWELAWAQESPLGYQDAAVAAQGLTLPDPLAPDLPCHAVDSFLAYGRATYLLRGQTPVYLLAGSPGLRALALYLPTLRVVLELGPSRPAALREDLLANTLGVQLQRLARHATAYATVAQATPEACAAARQVVLGLAGWSAGEAFATVYRHGLAGLERLALTGRLASNPPVLSAGHASLAALGQIYPELAAQHQHLERDAILSPHPFSLTHLLVGVGGNWVPASLRERVLRAAAQLDGPSQPPLDAPGWPAEATPRVWLGLGDAVTADVVAELVQRVRQEFAHTAFVLDGPPAQTQALAERLGGAQAQVRTVAGLEVGTTLGWAAQVDVYLAPAGHAQHKVAWFSPGIGIAVGGPELARTPAGRRPGCWEAEDVAEPVYVLASPREGTSAPSGGVLDVAALGQHLLNLLHMHRRMAA